jgi:hypothetical protein
MILEYLDGSLVVVIPFMVYSSSLYDDKFLIFVDQLPATRGLLNSCKEGRPMVKTEKLLEQAMSRETQQGSRELEFAS